MLLLIASLTFNQTSLHTIRKWVCSIVYRVAGYFVVFAFWKFLYNSFSSVLVKVQIHGPVSLSENVDCIVVNSRHRGDKGIEKLLDTFIERNNCNLIWMNPDEPARPSTGMATHSTATFYGLYGDTKSYGHESDEYGYDESDPYSNEDDDEYYSNDDDYYDWILINFILNVNSQCCIV